MLKKQLLDIIACPQCKASIEYNKENKTLVCQPCKLAYPVKDGFPVMLIEQAKPI